MTLPPSRRQFLGASAGSAVALASAPILAQAGAGPSRRVTIGILGLNRGMQVAAHFIAAIRSGDHFGLSAQIEKGHRSTLLCHLGNIAYRTQRTLICNPENGHVPDDPAAMAFWQREYERGWKPVV